MHHEITATLGRHCGLNADWSTRAWQLNAPADLWLLDDEDGAAVLVRRIRHADGSATAEDIATCPLADWRSLLPLAELNARLITSGFCALDAEDTALFLSTAPADAEQRAAMLDDVEARVLWTR